MRGCDDVRASCVSLYGKFSSNIHTQASYDSGSVYDVLDNSAFYSVDGIFFYNRRVNENQQL